MGDTGLHSEMWAIAPCNRVLFDTQLALLSAAYPRVAMRHQCAQHCACSTQVLTPGSNKMENMPIALLTTNTPTP